MRTAMSNETKETGSSFMEKLSTVIVDKRNLIFLLTIILLVFSAFSRNWVEVESDLTYYLPSDSETKQALDIMDEQFTTYGTAEVMVANITPEQAAALEPKIKEIKGVQSVDYDETTAHYNNLSALYSLTFAYSEDDEACLDSLNAVKEYLSNYDLYVDTDLGNTQQETIDHEISVIMVYVAIVIVLVLLFTFNSAGMPVLLILVIQGCIWLNFSFPTITGKYIFFLGYLIVSSIQMGANIDYAIVIASRYQELKSKMHHRDAIVETLNFAFPTIITSGSILSICGFLIGSMTSEPVIAGIGESLGRGTVISIIMVMFALPQILLIGSGIVDKTSFSVPSITEKKSGHGKVSVNGMVRGNINGTVHGIMHATVEGDIDLNLISGSANEEQDDEED